MYTSHFGLTAEPFSLTPDPEFLYLSPGHAEALAALKIGLMGKRGLMVMSGEVGTGKTTLLYALLRALGEDMRTAYVSNTALGFDGLLRLALIDFAVTPESPARIDMLTALNRLLRDCAERGRTATLIVDEAQNLDDEVFEQLRLLSNFETFTHKLLQIVLVGQPELEARLRHPALRALAERVAVHCRLAPLDERESRAYLDYRLLRAGGSTRLFEREAREVLLAAAEGLPRRINILCHNALLFAYGRGAERVSLPVAQLAVAGRAALLQDGPSPQEDPVRTVAPPPPRRVPRLAAAFGGAALVAALGVAGLRAPARQPALRQATEPPPPALDVPAAAALPPAAAIDVVADEASASATHTVVNSVRSEPVEALSDEAAGRDIDVPTRDSAASAGEVEVLPAAVAAAAQPEPPVPSADTAALGFRTVRVLPGSTLGSLARAVYGGVDPALIKRIQSANPHVVDPNVIIAGDLLRFPEVVPGAAPVQKGDSE